MLRSLILPPKGQQPTLTLYGQVDRYLPRNKENQETAAVSQESSDKMGSRIDLFFLVMFIVGLPLVDGRSLALDDVVGDWTTTECTISLTAKGSPQLCQLCEQFATEVLFYLNENETQFEITSTLHQACSKFYSFKLECTKLVDYYAPLFFTKIATLSPNKFCVSISLCEDATSIHLPTRKDACSLCHEIVDEILADLEDPDMELKIIEILLKGCNNAENFVQQCKRLIIQNAPVILEHIEKFLRKRDFCNSIHVCRSKGIFTRAKALSTA